MSNEKRVVITGMGIVSSIGNNVDPNDLPDLIENHMDYSSESCSNMFTMEQSIIMRGVLENERIDLINPPLGALDHLFNNENSTNYDFLFCCDFNGQCTLRWLRHGRKSTLPR